MTTPVPSTTPPGRNIPANRPRGRQSNYSARPIREYSPDKLADKSTSGVGLLAAEFFGILFLLVVELFAGTDSYEEKMLSIMKRATLVFILFFLLAIIAGVGDNASKIAKGIGGLVFVGILLSSPGETILSALDNFFKADWTSKGATGSTSADSGTQESSGSALVSGSNTAEQIAQSAGLPTVSSVAGIPQGVVTILNGIKNDLSGAAKKSFEQLLGGII